MDDRVVYGEDIIISLAYLAEVESLNVIDYVGYNYCIDKITNSKKYDYEKMWFSMYYLEQALDKIHCDEWLNIKTTIFWRKYSVLFNKISTKSNETIFYYPYYGRLNSKRVIIYGAGDVGRSYFQSIKGDMLAELVGWVDKNGNKIREASDLPVSDLGRLEQEDYDCIIVAVASESVFKQIKQDLIEKYNISEDKILWNATKLVNLY